MTDSYYQMSDTCATCGERYGQHCGMRCPDKAGQFFLAAKPPAMTDSYHFESVPKFRVGGVYRDGLGRIYLLREAGGEKLAVAAAWDSCDRDFDPRGELHRLDNGRFDALDFQESHWHLIPGELVQRDGQWVAADAPIVFPSGASVLTSGDKIVGRVEASPATYDVSVGNSLLTAEELYAGLREVLDALRAQDATHEPERDPLPHFNQRTEFDPFPDYVVFHEFEPTAPLHTSPTTQGAYPAIAGLLRG